MEEKCMYCVKSFPDKARLNFHIKKLHSSLSFKEDENNQDCQVVPSVGKSVEVEKPGRIPILKFCRIAGTEDYSVQPFRVGQPLKWTNPHRYDEGTKTKKREEKVSREHTNGLEDLSSSRIVPVSVELPASRLSPEMLEIDPDMPVLSPQISPSSRIASTATCRRVVEGPSASSCSNIICIDLVDDEDQVNPLSNLKFTLPSVSPGTTSSPREVEKNNHAKNSCDGMETNCSKTLSKEGQLPKRGGGKISGMGDRQKMECPVCGERNFRNKWYYNNHLEVHEGKRPFLCPICRMGYETEIKVLEHVSIRHSKEAAFKCNNCRLEYKTGKGLASHKCIK